MLIIVIFLYRKKENYDGRISNVTSDNGCANMCSSIYGCTGFAYDSNTNKCYLSKFPITAPPMPALYSNEYNTSNMYCNKSLPILSDTSINNDLYVDNSIYDCYTKNAVELGKFYYDFQGPKKVITFNDVYSMKKEPYKIQNLDWDNITDKIDLQFDKDYNLIYDPKAIKFIADQSHEHIGDYVNAGKCKTETSLDKCLSDCKNSSVCDGVEYSTNYRNYNNVCCPKRNIKKVITRRPDAINGIYYTKSIEKDNSDKNTIII